MDLKEAADRLRSLHVGPEPLVLPNVWDGGTARAVAEAGFTAVATTSSGMSASLGWADGERTPVDEMFWAIGRIARCTDLPLTADIESGYGLSPDEIVRRMLAAGAVGCNLEDTDHAAGGQTLRDASAQAERLAAVKRAAGSVGVDIVLNARVDVFLRQSASDASAVDEAVRRGRLYLEAGADCIFPIGVPDEAAIATLVADIAGPINVIAGFRGAPGAGRLGQLGVRRISYAGRLHRAATIDHQRRLAAIRKGEEI
jgi:2-methylisocitrate lyase-like PEP mutase family enzyme